MSNKDNFAFDFQNREKKCQRIYLVPKLTKFGLVKALTQNGSIVAKNDSIGGSGVNCNTMMQYNPEQC